MKNKSWYENIPEQGILCRDDKGNIINIVDYFNSTLNKMLPFVGDYGGHVLYATPLTPQEFWSFAPWNYNMSSADRSKRLILNYKGKIILNAFYGINGWESGGVSYNEADAWLPLPDNK